METIRSISVKTRKPHNCWGCKGIIPVGSKDLRTVSVDGDKISGAYWCENCEAFMGTLDSYDLQDGFLFGEIKALQEQYVLPVE